MSKKLNISLYARILASFVVLSVTVIAILAMGYLVAKKLANGEVEDVASYMRKYQIRRNIFNFAVCKLKMLRLI